MMKKLLITCFLSISSFLIAIESFDYATIEIDGQEVTTKYIEFEEPLRVHRARGFDIKGNIKDYPQWVQYYQYANTYSEKNRKFNPDMYPSSISKKDLNIAKEKWNKVLQFRNSNIDRINQMPEEEQYMLMRGLLFANNNETNEEYFFLNIFSNVEDLMIGTAAFLINNKIKSSSYKGGEFFMKNIAPIQDLLINSEDIIETIKKIKATGKGLLRLEGNPLHFDLVTMKMLEIPGVTEKQSEDVDSSSINPSLLANDSPNNNKSAKDENVQNNQEEKVKSTNKQSLPLYAYIILAILIGLAFVLIIKKVKH